MLDPCESPNGGAASTCGPPVDTVPCGPTFFGDASFDGGVCRLDPGPDGVSVADGFESFGAPRSG